MPTLNYHHLRYFWAIAHEGGLTRASERLNLSPSALSLQLQTLEQQLGHKLFDRQGKRLILTEAGRIALDYADTVVQAGDELMSTLQGRPTASRAAISASATQPSIRMRLRVAVSRATASRPGVRNRTSKGKNGR